MTQRTVPFHMAFWRGVPRPKGTPPRCAPAEGHTSDSRNTDSQEYWHLAHPKNRAPHLGHTWGTPRAHLARDTFTSEVCPCAPGTSSKGPGHGTARSVQQIKDKPPRVDYPRRYRQERTMIEIMLGYRDEACHLVNAAIEGAAVRVAPLLDWLVTGSER